jgi:hypothetical protein
VGVSPVFPRRQAFLTWNMSVPDDVLDAVVRPQAKQAALDLCVAMLERISADVSGDVRRARYELVEMDFVVRRSRDASTPLLLLLLLLLSLLSLSLLLLLLLLL